MFEHVEAAERDAILGLNEAFRNDPRPHKVNLSVGVFQDEHGHTPLLDCVAEAERRLAAQRAAKSYLPISGAPAYGKLVSHLLWGEDAQALAEQRVAFAQTPGGTGALRVAADLIHTLFPAATVWLSAPTWPNHPQIFAAAGVTCRNYPYFNADANALDLDAMLQAIAQMPRGDVILLHGCCHNPTGVDPSPEQWRRIAEAVRAAGLLPLVDFAYQGFAAGVEEDALGLRILSEQPGAELLACASFSKNFSLYSERVGALGALATAHGPAQAVQSQINRVIRANYSNPPAHGAQIVECVLGDAALRRQWVGEVDAMRGRILGMRTALVDALVQRGVPGDYSFIAAQRGMFSFSGLTPAQVDRLQTEYAIYIVRSGRINVAGLTPANLPRVADAMAQIVA
jgi:aspartate/tyrosine/aromatic aminotransferase